MKKFLEHREKYLKKRLSWFNTLFYINLGCALLNMFATTITKSYSTMVVALFCLTVAWLCYVCIKQVQSSLVSLDKIRENYEKRKA